MGWLKSTLTGMRAAKLLGRADASRRLEDLDGAMAAYRQALTLLEEPGVDVMRPGCRSSAFVALYGYARFGDALGRRQDVLALLEHWRPVFQRWRERPRNRGEAEGLAWLDTYLRGEAR